VSRVLHGHDRVHPLTRERVQKVIDELAYVPNASAQSLSRRRKEVVGIISVERFRPQYDVETMSLLFYDEILRGVESRLADEGWSCMITFLGPEDPRGLARLQSLSGKVDGLMVVEGIVASFALARLAERVPVVVIAGDPKERLVDSVVADNRSGTVALVEHLVKVHRRRRIFHVDGPVSAPDARERRSALEGWLARNREGWLVGSYTGDFSVRSGIAAGERIVAEHDDDLPDAIVCANDQMAIGVLQAFASAGIAVPETVSVVGFDDIYPALLSQPSLTTVHQPMRLIGERACARLLERIAEPSGVPRVEMLPTELVVRSSCGCPAGTEQRIEVGRHIEEEGCAQGPALARRARPKGRRGGVVLR
jgi:LacI family transcriptional regulator